MTVTINGQEYHFAAELSISQVLQELKLAADRVVIELNREIITADAHDRQLKDGDNLEVIQFVGGG